MLCFLIEFFVAGRFWNGKPMLNYPKRLIYGKRKTNLLGVLLVSSPKESEATPSSRRNHALPFVDLEKTMSTNQHIYSLDNSWLWLLSTYATLKGCNKCYGRTHCLCYSFRSCASINHRKVREHWDQSKSWKYGGAQRRTSSWCVAPTQRWTTVLKKLKKLQKTSQWPFFPIVAWAGWCSFSWRRHHSKRGF